MSGELSNNADSRSVRLARAKPQGVERGQHREVFAADSVEA